MDVDPYRLAHTWFIHIYFIDAGTTRTGITTGKIFYRLGLDMERGGWPRL